MINLITQSKNASIWIQNPHSKKNGYSWIATSLLKQNHTSNVLEPCLLVWGGGDCMVEFLCINARVCAPLPLTKIREACVNKLQILAKKLLAILHVLCIGHMQKTWNILTYWFTKATHKEIISRHQFEQSHWPHRLFYILYFIFNFIFNTQAQAYSTDQVYLCIFFYTSTITRSSLKQNMINLEEQS
jgi:hypothetical protein